MFRVVSIPLWFSRNGTEKGSTKNVPGSFHTTMVLTQPVWWEKRGLSHWRVSIPLWFSRNRQWRWKVHRQGGKFPYHYGSHATGLQNIASMIVKHLFPYHYGSHATQNKWLITTSSGAKVSIPLWFSRNAETPEQREKRIRSFHTTMVLTQPNY